MEEITPEISEEEASLGPQIARTPAQQPRRGPQLSSSHLFSALTLAVPTASEATGPP